MPHVIVLDPGHGGDRAAGGSSSNRSRGPNGLLEKDVALDIAKRVASALSGEAEVRLTRHGDVNLPLSERAAVAYNASADAFVSLHWNSSPDLRRNAVEAFVARDAAAASRALAADLTRRVAEATEQQAGPLHMRDLGVLVPSRHRAITRSCLVELGYLTHPAQALRLEQEAYRERVAQAIAKALIERLRSGSALESALDAGDGPPSAMRKLAVDECWSRCQQFAKSISQAGNPATKSAADILRETGVKVDANPYLGITRDEVEAVVRAANTSRQPPEVLLALWVKEGSSRSVTSPLAILEAKTEAHARTLFRCKVYYEDMGIDHFIVTTRPVAGGDNVYDKSDGAADGHQKHFRARVAELVKDHWLGSDVAAAIDGELTVSTKSGAFAVVPTVRFYALSLLLADALFTRFMNTATAELGAAVPEALNYMHWNMGTESFKKFLASADKHRKEPVYTGGGASIGIEAWALHRKPKPTEYEQPRINAIRFMHYLDSYRPVFAGSMSSIHPGLLDLRRTPPGTEVAEILQQATGPRMHHWVLLSSPYRTPEEAVRKIMQGAGLSQAKATALPAAGLVPLTRMMDILSDAALEDLFRFLNYSARQLENPPLANNQTQAEKLKRLPARLLIALPGHARETARSVASEVHAYFIETLGWLLMHAVRDELVRKGEPRWWVPPLPAFASRFPTNAPGAPDWVRDLARRFNLVDASVTEAQLRTRCDAWRNGLPGQQWRLETGHQPGANDPAGRAFYASLVAAQLPVNIDRPRVQANKAAIDAAWTARVGQVDTKFGHLSADAIKELRKPISPAVYGQPNIMGRITLGTMRILGGDYPQTEAAGRSIGRDFVNCLGGLQNAFSPAFDTIDSLGWNDLLFHTSGSMVFRGINNSNNNSAYTLSNHAYGAAIDIQAFENPQREANHTISPRIEGVFKAFGFRWGNDYQPPTDLDPMHFEFLT
ncbi:MAG: N-acetylmuramoyl-L-alanine amidase [Burkholderiales bacterium]